MSPLWGPVPASNTDVIPNLLALFMASFSPSSISSLSYDGKITFTSSIAFSRNTPDGSPVIGSRSMCPFSGSLVLDVTPASDSAFELTQAE